MRIHPRVYMFYMIYSYFIQCLQYSFATTGKVPTESTVEQSLRMRVRATMRRKMLEKSYGRAGPWSGPQDRFK